LMGAVVSHKCEFHPDASFEACGNEASHLVWLGGGVRRYFWVCDGCWDKAQALWKRLETEVEYR
jgi:hypothetical protein